MLCCKCQVAKFSSKSAAIVAPDGHLLFFHTKCKTLQLMMGLLGGSAVLAAVLLMSVSGNVEGKFRNMMFIDRAASGAFDIHFTNSTERQEINIKLCTSSLIQNIKIFSLRSLANPHMPPSTQNEKGMLHSPIGTNNYNK